MQNKFWMVLIDGTRSTSYKHASLESARIEAERLLRQYYPGHSTGVTILEAVEYGKITWPPMEWEPISSGVYQGREITPAPFCGDDGPDVD